MRMRVVPVTQSVSALAYSIRCASLEPGRVKQGDVTSFTILKVTISILWNSMISLIARMFTF
jgi:hypothetical protein